MTTPDVEAAVERLTKDAATWQERRTSVDTGVCVVTVHCRQDDLRTLLASHAALVARAKADGEALAELEHVAVTLKAAFVRDGTYDGEKGAVLRRYPAAIRQARARLQARE